MENKDLEDFFDKISKGSDVITKDMFCDAMKKILISEEEITKYAEKWSNNFDTENANRSIAYTSYQRGGNRIINLCKNYGKNQL